VDDPRLDYTPNQGVWGAAVRTSAFADDGHVMAVTGDVTAAYAPSCFANHSCRNQPVRRALRTLVYVRPALLVVADRVTLDDPRAGVTFAAHFAVQPVVAAGTASARVGRSRVDMHTLVPNDASANLFAEPTATPESVWRKSSVVGHPFRLEVATPRRGRERRLLHWITTGAVDGITPDSRGLSGHGLSGGRGVVAGRSVVVLVADDDGGGSVDAGGKADVAIVAGLKPGAHYAAQVAPPSCRVTVRPASSGGEASAGGTLPLDLSVCH
jgi:hypothetical protein